MRDNGSSKHHVDKASKPLVDVHHRSQPQTTSTDTNQLCKQNRRHFWNHWAVSNSRFLLQVVQECIGFQLSSSSSLCWPPWAILRSLLFKLLSAVWPQTAASLLASCHLQQADHVLVKVCLHQPPFVRALQILHCMINHAKALVRIIC